MSENWKEKYDQLSQEFAEFQDNSREYEKELEENLQRAESRIEELQVQLARNSEVTRSIQERAEREHKEAERTINTLMDNVKALQIDVNALTSERQRLEQLTDDLERKSRAAEAAVRHTTEKLDDVLEKYSLTQNELEEIRQLASATEQRLREEVQNLSSELVANQAKTERVSPLSSPCVHRCDSSNGSTSPGRSNTGPFVGPVRTSNTSTISSSPQNGLSYITPKVDENPSPSVLVNNMRDRVQSLQSRIAACQDSLQHLIKMGTPSKSNRSSFVLHTSATSHTAPSTPLSYATPQPGRHQSAFQSFDCSPLRQYSGVEAES
eukprot:TRINITY_DN18516_c0_g1::TRINITY_DN18516_c0_g1_i1::g.2778::m.2778 TRINITY_DN18516_c0_g1::TRINITY_DN18516_c0_g1_i1::g.2778  ORF type:complete len:323 (+),score=10.37,sp/Q9NXR1/NDE1_HUMAN/29.29/3e-20,Tropomyosin_1/PF12718.2/0.0031,Tropomyosin_1/PF12718.2/5.5e+02,Tropomyosin_1/PF12718.2/3.2e+03,NPV_P10/PF05531.7/58,NPV_P10/PF05531.7/2,NPV_P10/PF05531.7/42,ATP-synt_D/PF01813.12/0.35,ATP-synt_D/PF01813.12/13,WEMBL/PF05701.6/0.032,WEMBL/PF05701.6/1.4e+03,DUF148/PF02520.12/0.18,DUF148/PF02520.12/2.9,T2SG